MIIPVFMLIVAAASHQNENSFNYRLMLESLVETKRRWRTLVNSGDNRIFWGGSYQKKKSRRTYIIKLPVCVQSEEVLDDSNADWIQISNISRYFKEYMDLNRRPHSYPCVTYLRSIQHFLDKKPFATL